jgi:hypothetical protein
MAGKAALERLDDLRRLVDGEGRLRDVGDRRVCRKLESLRVLDALDEDGCVGRLPHRSDDLFVPSVADEDDPVAVSGVAPRLDVHLGHQRAGRVDRVQLPLRRSLVDGRGDAVGGEDEGRAEGHLRLVLDEDGAELLELPHDVRIVDDLLPHVHRRAVQRERALHRLHGAFYSGAIPPRRCEQDPLNQTESTVATTKKNGVKNLPKPDQRTAADLPRSARAKPARVSAKRHHTPKPREKRSFSRGLTAAFPAQKRKRPVARGGRWRRASS